VNDDHRLLAGWLAETPRVPQPNIPLSHRNGKKQWHCDGTEKEEVKGGFHGRSHFFAHLAAAAEEEEDDDDVGLAGWLASALSTRRAPPSDRVDVVWKETHNQRWMAQIMTLKVGRWRKRRGQRRLRPSFRSSFSCLPTRATRAAAASAVIIIVVALARLLITLLLCAPRAEPSIVGMQMPFVLHTWTLRCTRASHARAFSLFLLCRCTRQVSRHRAHSLLLLLLRVPSEGTG